MKPRTKPGLCETIILIYDCPNKNVPLCPVCRTKGLACDEQDETWNHPLTNFDLMICFDYNLFRADVQQREQEKARFEKLYRESDSKLDKLVQGI